ncbi:MAG TPA: Nif3-like dinuclear metal center hexameric protein [Methanomicrobiales archaeon]|nr:Nif3-like dinuclear metal center hexameric protein [Methanomicrobiales archaeon]
MQRDGIIRELAALAPQELADTEDDGRIGLVIEGRADVGDICTALDVTPRVVARTVESGAGMLVVHHTPLWEPVTSLTGPLGSLLGPLFANRVNVFVMHTNFDRAPRGINDALAELLDLRNTEVLRMGLVGDCSLDPEGLARRLGGPVRVWGRMRSLTRLAIVGGSGFDPDLILEAAYRGADAFLSAEMKHHVALSAPIPCIEATHYALEAPGMRRIASQMGWQFIDDPPEVRNVP